MLGQSTDFKSEVHKLKLYFDPTLRQNYTLKIIKNTGGLENKISAIEAREIENLIALKETQILDDPTKKLDLENEIMELKQYCVADQNNFASDNSVDLSNSKFDFTKMWLKSCQREYSFTSPWTILLPLNNQVRIQIFKANTEKLVFDSDRNGNYYFSNLNHSSILYIRDHIGTECLGKSAGQIKSYYSSTYFSRVLSIIEFPDTDLQTNVCFLHSSFYFENTGINSDPDLLIEQYPYEIIFNNKDFIFEKYSLPK